MRRAWRSRSFEGLCYPPLSTAVNERTAPPIGWLAWAVNWPGGTAIEFDRWRTRCCSTRRDAFGVDILRARHCTGASAVRQRHSRELGAANISPPLGHPCGGGLQYAALLRLSGPRPQRSAGAQHGLSVKTRSSPASGETARIDTRSR